MQPRFILYILFFVASSGCVTTAHIEPLKGEGQSLEYKQGNGFLFSPGARSSVGIVAENPEYSISPRLSFLIRIENRGEDSVEIAESNISAIGNGLPLLVISAQQLAQEARTQAAWASVAVAFAGAANQYNAAQAGQTTYSGTTSATVYGSGNSSHVIGTYNGTAYDSGKAWQAQQQASQQTSDQLTTVEAQKQSQLNYIDTSIIQRTTVTAGAYVQGYVVIDAPKPRNPINVIDIMVQVANDVHHFIFHESKLQ